MADTEEQASHLREPCDRQRQVGNACGPGTSRPALSVRSLSGKQGGLAGSSTSVFCPLWLLAGLLRDYGFIHLILSVPMAEKGEGRGLANLKEKREGKLNLEMRKSFAFPVVALTG